MPRRSQEDRSRTTRTMLEQAGRRLFAEHGYTGTSAAQLVTEAGVTRGALQHHYGDKRGLFLAVLEQLETEITAEVRNSLRTAATDDILVSLASGLNTFLELCQRPEVVRIALFDAPAVLGWQAWREMEARHGLGLITAELERARAMGAITAEAVPVLAQLLLSAVSEAGLIVAHAEDKENARTQTQQSLLLLVSGLLRI
ncbi:TetR/AcrR family transcriptional regulator [Nocardia sp. NPDC001965]